MLGFVNADLYPSETQLRPVNLSIPFKMKMRKELILMSDAFAAACPVVCGLCVDSVICHDVSALWSNPFQEGICYMCFCVNSSPWRMLPIH